MLSSTSTSFATTSGMLGRGFWEETELEAGRKVGDIVFRAHVKRLVERNFNAVPFQSLSAWMCSVGYVVAHQLFARAMGPTRLAGCVFGGTRMQSHNVINDYLLDSAVNMENSLRYAATEARCLMFHAQHWKT